MKKIKLKHKSPEFLDDDQLESDTKPRICDVPECLAKGEHKAPKARDLNEYYYFCLQHVQEYNKTWNFFDGMSDMDIQKHMEANLYGHRPTWIYSSPDMERELRRKVSGLSGFDFGRKDDKESTEQAESENAKKRDLPSQYQGPEVEALAIMGLQPPITLQEIKAQYKILAKKYHPDHNRNDKNAEEVLKKVNMAYTVLKAAFAVYEEMER